MQRNGIYPHIDVENKQIAQNLGIYVSTTFRQDKL